MTLWSYTRLTDSASRRDATNGRLSQSMEACSLLGEGTQDRPYYLPSSVELKP